MSLDEQLVAINWPNVSGEYKFVQLDVDGRPHLRFAEDEWEIHGTILMKLLTNLRIPYTEILSRSETDVPALTGERYRVYGFGKSKIDVEQRIVSLYGKSFDYNIGIDRTHLESIKSSIGDWNIKLS